MLKNGLVTEESEGLLPKARDICSSVIVHTDSTAYAASYPIGTGWFSPWGVRLPAVYSASR